MPASSARQVLGGGQCAGLSMACDYNIVAIRWRGGEYAVVAAEVFNQGVDWARLLELAPLRNVPIQADSYIDQATIVSRDQLQHLLTDDRARVWFYGKAAEADLFMIHRAEWDS